MGSSGTPESTKFGMERDWTRLIGSWVGTEAADSIGMDWIGLDLDWARCGRNEMLTQSWKKWILSCEKAGRYELATLISITNPPRWASTPNGPDTPATARLVLFLAERYKQNDLSIELFPAQIQSRDGS